MKDGLSKTVPWNICRRRRKESVFLGHLKKRNIYTFYKVSTDRFHTRGQQLWILFFFLEQKKVLQKKRVQSPRDFFSTPIWLLWDLCENDPYSNHCLWNILWVEGWMIHLYSALVTVDNEQYRFRNRLLNTVYWYVQEICSLTINNTYFTILSFKYLMLLYIIPWVDWTISSAL